MEVNWPIRLFLFAIDVIGVLGNEYILKQITHVGISILLNPNGVGRSTRMHCIYENFNNIY